MGTYNLPRNVKGEGRILFIFSTKSLIFTVAFVLIGILLFALFSALNLNLVGFILLIIFALTGFIIGTFKVPNLKHIKWASTNAGQNIDDVILRAIKFKKKGNKIYIYKRGIKEDETNDN